MNQLVDLAVVIWPEALLAAMGCVLFLMGVGKSAATRRACAMLALATVVAIFVGLILRGAPSVPVTDPWKVVRLFEFAYFMKLLVSGVAILLILLAWPTDDDATGNPAMNFGQDAGEFFGLMLLALAGLMLTVSANDLILLFLAIELASIPTYVMVSISRPIPVAQEAGVKYFFLGAMSAAIMLFGFSYLYGTTGLTNLRGISDSFLKTMGAASVDGSLSAPVLTAWQTLAAMMIVIGLAFKMAVVPLHFYAADVYQGAATPVTAFLSFVPKATGFVALIKILSVFSGGTWLLPSTLAGLLWVLAALTMTVGNVLGLLQFNVKRVLAYSSIAHSGYMLVGLAALAYAPQHSVTALGGVMFYLAAYGIMNAAAFGVLIALPARPQAFNPGGMELPPATSAETFEDLAGQGRHHVALGLAMTVACLSLTGIPLTVGFLGKFLLIKPALLGGLYGLAILTVINAAISAAYYLRIVASLFLRPEPTPAPNLVGGSVEREPTNSQMSLPVGLAVGLSVVGTLLFGSVFPAADFLTGASRGATQIDDAVPLIRQTAGNGSTGSEEHSGKQKEETIHRFAQIDTD